MTLLEILNKVKFVDLVEPLVAIDKQTADNLYSFKEAFDLVRMMSPKESDGIDIDVSRLDCEDGNPPCLSAWFHVREEWEVMLARKVVVADDCKATDGEIAAILLWELTFWGFSPEEFDEVLDRKTNPHDCHVKGNPFAERHQRLEQRHHDLNCRYKEDVGTKYHQWKNDGDMFWTPKRNGAKRHRERRHERTLELLEKKMNRWDLCETLISRYKQDGEAAEWLCDEMMNGSDFCHYNMQSRTREGDEIEYLTELVREYFPQKEGSKSIVFISGPQRIMGNDRLEDVSSAFKIPLPRFIRTTDDNLKNLRVDLLVFE